MIRHAGLYLAATIAPLAVAVIETAFGTLLVAVVGATSLAYANVTAASETAIALPAIASHAHVEFRAAFLAPAHPRSQAIV